MARTCMLIIGAALCACSTPTTDGLPDRAPRGSLQQLMDDVRVGGGLFVAAHRGGPSEGYPENALETLQHGFDRGLRMFEIDVAESQDGKLYLMHDRSLRRTAGYDGAVADTDWSVVADLDLRDPSGAATGFRPPRLDDVLSWAVSAGAILELDRKSTTSFRRIVEAVRAIGAADQVLLITYSDDEAIQVAKIAPELMMTAGVWDDAQRGRLEEAGVDMRNVVAWMGTREADAALVGRWRERGIECAFGTLGRPGRRLDDEYTADGDASEYQALADAGVVLLATDRPFWVADRLKVDDIAVELVDRAR